MRQRLHLLCPGLYPGFCVALFGTLFVTLGLMPSLAMGSQLIYQPTNPAFGGNPLNGNYLLNNAQAQDTHADPNAPTPRAQLSSLERFNEQLERAILSRVTSTISSAIIGTGGELKPGTVETSGFVITVTDVGDGRLRILTTDKANGDSTAFEIDTLF